MNKKLFRLFYIVKFKVYRPNISVGKIIANVKSDFPPVIANIL